MANPDPDKLILGWADKNPPLWVDRSLYKDCKHCGERFQRGHQHYCRLCGHMYCSMCTGKYHIPLEFRKKGKDGAVRVCFGCRDECLERRAKLSPFPALRPHQVISKVNGREHIHPPEWVDITTYTECWMCKTSMGKHPYHCRLCGEMFCEECTTKTEVKRAFRKKLHKTGPVRICFECRYKLKNNAEMDENPPKPEYDDNYADEIKNVTPQTEPSRPQTNRGGLAQFPSHIGPSPIQNSDAMARLSAPEKTLNVLKKGTKNQANQLLTTIQVAMDATLVQIDEKVLQQFPALKNRPFHYLCRGKPVYKEHWDIFHMKFFPEVVIGKGAPPEIDDDGVPQGGTAPRPSILSTQGAEGIGVGGLPPGHGVPPSNAGRFSQAQDNKQQAFKQQQGAAAAGLAAAMLSKQKQGDDSSGVVGGGGGGGFGMPPGGGGGGPPGGGAPGGGAPGGGGGSSITPTQEPAKPKPKAEKKPIPADAIYVRAKYMYEAQTPTNISFGANDILLCIKHEADSQWWFGHQIEDTKKGWFPASYVEQCDPPPGNDEPEPKPEPEPQQPSQQSSFPRPGGGAPFAQGSSPGGGGQFGGGGPPPAPGGGGGGQYGGGPPQFGGANPGGGYQPSQIVHPNQLAQGFKPPGAQQNGGSPPGGAGGPPGGGGGGPAGGGSSQFPGPPGMGGQQGPGGGGLQGGPSSPFPGPPGGQAGGQQYQQPDYNSPFGAPPDSSNGSDMPGPPGGGGGPPDMGGGGGGAFGGFPPPPGGANQGAPPPFPGGGGVGASPAGGGGGLNLGARKAGGYLPKKGVVKPVQKRGGRKQNNKLLNASRNNWT